MGEAKRRKAALDGALAGAALAAVTPDRLEIAARKAEAARAAKEVIDQGGRWFLAYVDPKTSEIKFSVNEASPELVMKAAQGFMGLVMAQMGAAPQPADPTV